MSWRGRCRGWGWDEDSGRWPRCGLGEGTGGARREGECGVLCGAAGWEDSDRSEGQVLRGLPLTIRYSALLTLDNWYFLSASLSFLIHLL